MESVAAAIVLAGGRSARMGRDKATLPFGDQSLLERIAAELRSAFAPVIVVAAPAAVQPAPLEAAAAGVIVVRDAIAFAGPVGALRRGMAAADRDCVFAAACDLPMLSARVAQELCAMLAEHDAVIPRVGGRLQMLHAAYGRRCRDGT
jgi:molybdopterin-guanine dinucleotide biosynthesis protein A